MKKVLLKSDETVTIQHTLQGTLVTFGVIGSSSTSEKLSEKDRLRIWSGRREILLALLVILKRKGLVPEDFNNNHWVALFLESDTRIKCPWLGLPILLAMLLNALADKANQGKGSFINHGKLKKVINIRFFGCFGNAESNEPFNRKQINQFKSLRSHVLGAESQTIIQDIMECLQKHVKKLDE